MKQNVNPAKVISEDDRIRIVKTLLNVKLQALDKELATLLKRSLPYAFFSQNFQSNCSSELLWIVSFERPLSKTSPSKTRKTSKDQKKKITYAPQNGSSEQKVKKIRGKCQCRSPALMTLPCDFIKTGLHHGYFPRNVPVLFRNSRFIKRS